jgi:hypothetical protein
MCGSTLSKKSVHFNMCKALGLFAVFSSSEMYERIRQGRARLGIGVLHGDDKEQQSECVCVYGLN